MNHIIFRSTAPLRMVAVVCLFATVGCNNSRYGVTHDRRLASIKTVAIVPASISVGAMHAGGVIEPRPDLVPNVLSRAAATVRQEVSDRGRKQVYIATDWDEKQRVQLQPDLSLLGAISEAIQTHHYQNGKQRFFDYVAGAAASDLLGNKDADAVLLMYLNAVVPTAGREFLAGTATVMGILTGINIQVSTEEAAIVLMLVHRETGEVLWYNMVKNTADVESERQLRKLIEKACDYLLERYEK